MCKKVLLIVLAILLAVLIFFNGWLLNERLSTFPPENVVDAWNLCLNGGCVKGPDYHYDESQSPYGPHGCKSDCCCDGERTCNTYGTRGIVIGYCEGTAREKERAKVKCVKGPDYHYDESKSPLGANKCDTDCYCDGARTCSKDGWCQGTAR